MTNINSRLARLSPGDTTTITLSDTVNVTGGPIYALYIGGAGHVTIVKVDGTTQLFSNVPIGILPLPPTLRVNLTGTTASLLVGYCG